MKPSQFLKTISICRNVILIYGNLIYQIIEDTSNF